MYNRYIGNTGKFIRVEDSPRPAPNMPRPGMNGRGQAAGPIRDGPPPIQQSPNAQGTPPPRPVPHPPASKGKSSLLGGLGGLKNLFGGLGGGGLGGLGGSGGLLSSLGNGNIAGNVAGSLRGMFDHLPFGLDVGDLLLLILLFFFFMESGDEEFIIILAFFAFSIYKDSKAVNIV